jgi:hypothetical protein
VIREGSPRIASASRRGTSGTALAVILLALLVAGIAYRYWPSDDREVRRHLVHLAEALSVPGKDSEVERITRYTVLGEYFAPDVQIVVDGRRIVSREALIDALTAWQPPPGGFTVEFVNETVTLSDDRASARITLTARVVSKDINSGEIVAEARDMAIVMAKAEGDWVITTAEARPAEAVR